MESIIYSAKGARIEAIAIVPLLPGQWVEWDTTAQSVHLDDSQDGATRMIVIEDSLNGRTIDDGYAVGEVVQLLSPIIGDVVYSHASGELSAPATAVELASGLIHPADASIMLRWRIVGVTLAPSAALSPFWVKVQVAGRA